MAINYHPVSTDRKLNVQGVNLTERLVYAQFKSCVYEEILIEFFNLITLFYVGTLVFTLVQ